MSHECHQTSCSQGSHSHGGCGSNCQCPCHQQCQCNCHSHEQGGCNYAKELLKLADSAWMEVVKEKIKEEIKKNSGKHIEELAKLVSDANHKRWNEKLAEKRNIEHFEDSLKHFLHK